VFRDASVRDLAALRDLLSSASDGPYDIGVVAEEKLFGAGVAGKPRTRIYEDQGEMRGVAVTCGHALRILAVARQYRRQRIGSALLRDAGSQVRLIFAEGGNYYTPGIVENDEGTRAFFRHHQFIESRWTSNLHAANLPQKVPDGVERPRDRDRFLRFVRRVFGAIWEFEAARALDTDPPRAFWVPDAGFAVHDVNNRGLGTFGPTGVAPEHRGKGLGTQLLLASLADLRRIGYTRAVIPWTDAIDFYRKACGAEVAHRFVSMTR
jgi:GNAT superfamily N-acetyltransferase